MSLDPSGASGFLCAQGARFLLHSGILIAAALLLGRLFGKSGLARSAIYRAALLAVILAPAASFSLERRGLSYTVRLPVAPPSAAVMPSDPEPAFVPVEASHAARTLASSEAPHAAPPNLPVAPPAKVTSRPMPKPATIIAALWAAGACLLAAWLLVSHVALWRTRRRSVPVKDPSTLARLKCLSERLRVRAPGLRISPDVGGPILAGALQPVVIIPQAQEKDLLDGALDRVLMHELAHQARRDCLWNLLARVVCATGFFQPLLWVLARRLEDASEDAADDRVLALGADARAYARDLATAAEKFVIRRPESVAGLGVIRFRSSLGRRVAHILDTSKLWVSSLSWRAIALLCAFTVLATVLTATLTFAGPADSPLKPATPATNADAPAAEPSVQKVVKLYEATDADLAALKDKQEIAALMLTDSKVTDAGLAHLKEMKGLRALFLGGTKVTDAGLTHLKGMKGLVQLYLSSTKVTDAGLAVLKEMQGLQTLSLADTMVTDAGLLDLKEMKGLQILSLAKTKVTDAGLANLKEMKGMQILFLGDTRVTEAGLADLRVALPNTRIRIDAPAPAAKPAPAKDLARAQEAWAAAVAGSDAALLARHAGGEAAAARAKAAVAEEKAPPAQLQDAVTLLNEATQALKAATAKAVTAENAARAPSVIARLEAEIARKEKFAAEDTLAELEKLIPADARMPGLREKVAAVPGPKKELTLDLGDGVKMEFVLIRPGSFVMGSDKDLMLDMGGGKKEQNTREKPAHKVAIAKSLYLGKYPVTQEPFYLGKYLITQEQWKAVMGTDPSHFKDARLPVEQVNWSDCRDLASALNARFPGKSFRLPSEAEWEYACRAGTATEYYFGDNSADLPAYGWYDSNANGKTHPVGEKKPNPWGLYDMYGNVWEWCQSEYKPYPYADDGREDTVTAGWREDTVASGWRVLRGGAWNYSASFCRSAARGAAIPTRRYDHIGCRLVMSVQE